MRHCPICRQFFCSVDSICITCQENLFRRINVVQAEVKLPFPVYSLWVWGKLDYSVSFLLYALKGGRKTLFYQSLVKECFFRFSFLQKEFLYIPAAGRGHDLDHAGLFAKALADVFSASVFNILCRVKNQKQKRLSKFDRMKNTVILKNINLAESFPDWKNKNILFIDDVLTTGSTALAAYKALGCPKHFKVLVLAYRPKIR